MAPSSFASASLAGLVSTAMMRSAPATTAPSNAFMPTPPRPTTAITPPGCTPAVFNTAPTPVSTAQPNSAACSSGTSLSMRTADDRAATMYCANRLSPLKCGMCSPFSFSRRPPVIRLPSARARLLVAHRFTRPRTQ